MNRKVLISIKPYYANKILDGTKTVELRKCRPNCDKGDVFVIYRTHPSRDIVGFFTIKDIVVDTVENIWKKYSKKTAVGHEFYLEYYSGRVTACAIIIDEVFKYDEPLSLFDIKLEDPSFSPPQTFKYIEDDMLFNELVPCV